jgi:hypothetical protein
MDNTNLFSYFKEKFFPSYKPEEHEQLIIDIINLLFDQDDTECLTAPISGKFYITNKRLNYWIRIGDSAVTITNHKFSYVAQSAITFTDYVTKVVREHIERDRIEFEKTVFQNELDLLQNIKSNITTTKK